MKKLSVVVALGLGLLVGACGDDNNDNTNNPGGGGGTPSSHLSGPAAANGSCDNPSEAPNNCYQYVGSTYAGTAGKDNCSQSSGTYSTTAGCGSSGRAGRCTLFAGTENEYVVHCYQSLSTCQTQCQGAGTFVAN